MWNTLFRMPSCTEPTAPAFFLGSPVRYATRLMAFSSHVLA